MDVNSSARPLVTVGIPTYNRPAGLDRTLKCIRGQTYRNLEILVSDNCSTTAESQAIGEAHARADERVRYHRQERNIGSEANFKFLLDRARGPFFFWAADDDEWTPDFVSVCMDHIGSAGSVMTGMRNAVRPRGLLRWKPPLDLSPQKGAFASAVAFLNNSQPSLFYGIHRTEPLRRFLSERAYDYYDYFFIIRQILTVGFQTAAPICFHIGIDTEVPVLKPARPRTGAVYEYRPFLRDALRATLISRNLGPLQKARLAFLLCYVALNEFSYFERDARPRRVRLAARMMRAFRAVRPLFGVPLPPPPPTMILPADPADLCTMSIPHARLESPEMLAADVAEGQKQLQAKLDVIRGLEGFLGLPARADGCADLLVPVPTGAPLPEFRHRLGSLLIQLDREEARIQELVPLRDARLGSRAA